MNSRNRHQSTDTIPTVASRHFQKEPRMNRLFIALLSALIVAIFALNPTAAFAQDSTPSDVDAADQAYLQEYHQRAVEKYQAMQRTQAAQAGAGMPDWGGEMTVREYDQRSRDAYAVIQKRTTPAVADGLPDWGGEMFLAEYKQRAQDRYRVWLAQQNGRLTGSTSR